MNQQIPNIPMQPMAPFMAPNIINNPNNQDALFVGELDLDINDQTLYSVFLQFGNIISAQVFKDQEGRSKGKAIVLYENKSDAERAIKELNNYKFKEGGKEMKVNFKVSKSDLDPQANVFIRGIYAPSNKDLEDLVTKYGEIVSCMLKTDKDGKSLQYGYVQFKKPEDANKCIEDLNGKEMWGNKLELEIFKAQRDRESFQNTIYLKNFPTSWNTEKIEEYVKENFEGFGDVENQTVWATNKNGKVLYQASVTYKEETAAQKAIEKFHNSELEGGNKLTVQLYVNKIDRQLKLENLNQDINKQKTLVLTGLKEEVTEDLIKEVFGEYGSIESVTLRKVRNKIPGQPDFQTSFLMFENHKDAQRTFYQGKQQKNVQDMFVLSFVKRGNFITFFQSKNVRNQYKQMKLRMNNPQGYMGMAPNMIPMGMPQQMNMPMMQQVPMPMGMPQQGFQQMPMGMNQFQQPMKPVQQSQPKQIYNEIWLMQNQDKFAEMPEEEQRTILGELMYEKVRKLDNFENDQLAKVTGMLIDREILDLDEIIEILNNNEKLIERAQEALEVIEEDNA